MSAPSDNDRLKKCTDFTGFKAEAEAAAASVSTLDLCTAGDFL